MGTLLMTKQTVDVFTPGRVCLFGEHSDWAGAYRRFNSEIPPGDVIIAGTNQGLHARACASDKGFCMRSTLNDGRVEEACVPMDTDALLKVAQSGGFFSYAAGVAYYMLTFYHVGGIEIDNYLTDLPVKKGLSSSAALCVLVARAFDRVYDLKMTVRAEMEAAYQGEILTPSRCGRMDQGCAFGQVPVKMTFDGDLLRTKELRVGDHIRILVGDLKGSKDTIRILGDLNRAYPFAEDDTGRAVQAYLGAINRALVDRAAQALRAGDAEALGKLMSEAQAEFDRHLMPACPKELTAPKLHAVLADSRIEQWAFGGKGVGSQGDGCVQFVVRGEEERQALANYLHETYGMDCFPLDLVPPKAVRKAVIPAAGLGSMMYPATKAVRRELFPVVTPDGICKPVLLSAVEEALAAGIEEIAIIVRPGEQDLFRTLFQTPPAPAYAAHVPNEARPYLDGLSEIGESVTLITQEEPLGFGHAIACAQDWAEGEPVLVLLGDHLYITTGDQTASRQLVDAYAEHRCPVVGLARASSADVAHYGTFAGEWDDDGHRLLTINEVAEKPTEDHARRHLRTRSLPEGQFLCAYGQYVIDAGVFACLQELINTGCESVELTTAFRLARQAGNVLGVVVDGERHDAGRPETYIASLVAYAGGGAKA
jgi:UTP-glucose-1-phosphate uridylyltransferase/galactokinase